VLPSAGKILLLLSIIVTLFFFGRRAWFLIKLLKSGRSLDRFDHPGERWKYTLGQVFTQRCSLKTVAKGDYAGIGHLLLFYGFCLFLVRYIFHIAEAFNEALSPAIFGSIFNNLFFLCLDMAGLIIMGAIVWAAIRRYILKPERLDPSLDAGIILGVIFTLMCLHYATEGFRFLADPKPFAVWSFVGTFLSYVFREMGWQRKSQDLYLIFWWLHILLVFGFGIFILYSKHLHILGSHFNLYFRPLGSKGALQLIGDLEDTESFAIDRVNDFNWKQLLDLYACTECGRCTENCPASSSGKALRPMDIIHNLKLHLLASGRELLKSKERGGAGKGILPVVGKVVTGDEFWACTTCHACVEVCPVNIEHVSRMVDMRRQSVLVESDFPAEYKQIFKNLEIFGDPKGKGKLTREDWTANLKINKLYQPEEGRPVDVLFWVGCIGATYDDRSKNTVIAAAKVLEKAGVNFGILGKEEPCCGDPALRMGNEYLFQKIANNNIEMFRKYGIKKIVTPCPHCFSVLKKEYASLGANFEISTLVDFIGGLLKEGRLEIKSKINATFTYHDPCYLGRHNSLYDGPREILQSSLGVNIVEMGRRKEKSFCCGAGGGNMWRGMSAGKRIEGLRIAEAVKTDAQGIVTACPYCEVMFDCAIKQEGLGYSFKLLDIVELVKQATID